MVFNEDLKYFKGNINGYIVYLKISYCIENIKFVAS